MKNVVGKPVSGDDFFGREHELQALRRIAEDEHVLLLAPRRVGKTSLLFALERELRDDPSMTGVYASVAAVQTEAQFVDTVLQAVHETRQGRRIKPNRFAAWMRRRGRRVKSVHAAGIGVELERGVDQAWQAEANRSFHRLLDAERPWLIMIDELPTLVLALARQDDTGIRVRAFLQWFRNLRQLPRAADKLRFILAGSIGLDSVTRRYQMSDTINDLRDWRLEPYSAETADAFLAKLGASYRIELEPALRARICEQAEWLIPYHLQMIFSALRDHTERGRPSEAALDAALEALLARKFYFSYWDERLRGALGTPEDEHARVILTACARDPQGATLATVQNALGSAISDGPARTEVICWILDVLVNDGYLVVMGRRWRFRSGLLRRYWRRHVA